ncbi:MAG: cation diffusion facilitator family transporter [Ruminococcus sp.]
MTELLIRKFIKNYDDTDNPRVREKYGTLSSIVGIVCNVMLFLLKYAMGTLAGSIAVISDAFNNLSDSASCIVTLFGYKLSAKPADKDHPFGHGRMEYLTSLIIAAVIIVMGIELFKTSAVKIIHPEKVAFRWIVFISLLVSIGVKLWMSLFNTKLGKKINSTVMLATAKDSRNDVIATLATVISVVASLFTDLPVDGVMGVLVSAFILKAGYEIIRDTVDELLGKPADAECVRQITGIVLCDERIIGLHDMIIHNYGPGNVFGSCHAEVRSTENFVSVHDLIDTIEHEIHRRMKIIMTIHIDPVEVDNEQLNIRKEMISRNLREISPELSFHDFRMVVGDTHTNLIFDIVVPFGFKMSDDEIKEKIDRSLEGDSVKFYTVITFDHSYTDSD